MRQVATIIGLSLFMIAISCSGPQGAERIESSAETSPRVPNESISHIGARPSIESEIDAAVERFDAAVDDYVLLISQAGRLAPVSNHTVELEPRPFTIWIIAQAGTGALVNVWYSPQARNTVIRGQELPGPLGEPGTGMAEEWFNQEREILLDAEMSNYWVYQDAEQHRFDNIEVRGDLIIGKRSVERLLDVERDETISVREFAGSSLSVVEFEYRPSQTASPKRAYTIEF